MLRFPDKKKKWKNSKHPDKYIAFKWASDNLSKPNAKRLKALPETLTAKIGDVHLLLTHGSPDNTSELLGPKTPDKRLQEIAKGTTADIILAGHTHVPFHKKIGDVTFLNPGSVGRPEGNDPRACYMMLDFSTAPVSIQFHRVSYDIERMTRALHAAGMPDAFSEMFRTGKNLDQVQDCLVEQHAFEMPESAMLVKQVRDFAACCRYEVEHSEHVTDLAQRLFTQLTSVHHLGKEAFFILTCASILHDAGYIQGVKGHHRSAMEMIMADTTLPLDDRRRRMIALAARYHRKEVPSQDHAEYAELSKPDQTTVCWLGGILRIADGLDRSHLSRVEDVDVQIEKDLLTIRCKSTAPIIEEFAAAKKKSDLLGACLARPIIFVATQ